MTEQTKTFFHLTYLEKELVKAEARAHFHTGPKRDKRLDDYFLLLKKAIEKNQPLPERPVFDAE